jgi:hypothetical protein
VGNATAIQEEKLVVSYNAYSLPRSSSTATLSFQQIKPPHTSTNTFRCPWSCNNLLAQRKQMSSAFLGFSTFCEIQQFLGKFEKSEYTIEKPNKEERGLFLKFKLLLAY